MPSRQLRLTFIGLALGILLALLLAPQTRWLVRLQTLISIGLYHPVPGEDGSYTRSPQEDERRREAVAARYPDDFPIQYAAADGKTNSEILVSLRELKTRFPNTPALDANILRYEMMHNLRLVRLDIAQLTGRKNDPRAVFNLPTPERLALFDWEAAAGEHLDPNNAYFPFMRAIGLFAAHRDAEGVEAVRRASRKPVWQEYLTDDIESRWRLHREAFGDAGALPRTAILGATMLPQYQGLSQAAQVVIVHAMRLEQNGHPQEGLQLREAVRRCGDLMRVQSTFVIGSAVGVGICATSCRRPGGAPPLQETAKEAEEFGNDKALTTRYAAYARGLGREDLARNAQAEFAAGIQVKALLQNMVRADDQARRTSTRLDDWWVADLLTLGNVLWVLLLGSVAGLARGGRLTAVSQIAGSVGLLFALLFLIGFGLIVMLNVIDWMQTWPDGLAYGVGLLTLATLGIGIRQAVRRIAWKTLGRFGLWRILGLMLLTILALSGLYALIGWQSRGIWETFAVRVLFFPSEPSDPGNDLQKSAIHLAQWWSFGGTILISLLTLLVLAIQSRTQHQPLLVRLVYGCRVAALPLACLLIILYGGLMLETVRQENAVNHDLERSLHGGGQYIAQLTGQPWPGPVQ